MNHVLEYTLVSKVVCMNVNIWQSFNQPINQSIDHTHTSTSSVYQPINQPSVPSNSRIKLLPPQYQIVLHWTKVLWTFPSALNFFWRPVFLPHRLIFFCSRSTNSFFFQTFTGVFFCGRNVSRTPTGGWPVFATLWTVFSRTYLAKTKTRSVICFAPHSLSPRFKKRGINFGRFFFQVRKRRGNFALQAPAEPPYRQHYLLASGNLGGLDRWYPVCDQLSGDSEQRAEFVRFHSQEDRSARRGSPGQTGSAAAAAERTGPTFLDQQRLPTLYPVFGVARHERYWQ